MHDLIIIGGSAAGVSAAIYAARRKLNFVLVSGDIGGEVLLCGEVENYPGIPYTTGVELAQKYQEQLEKYEVKTDLNTYVYEIIANGKTWIVKAKHGEEEKEYATKAIIIASGVKPRHLDVPGENEFYQKGVTYCTVCDGPLFKNKVTATIGTGNSALESALMMSQIAKQHYILTKYPEFKGEQVLIDKLKACENVTILYEAMTTKIEGEKNVKSLSYKDKEGAEHTIEVNGVFIHIGNNPQSNFVGSLPKEANGKIIVDKMCATQWPGVFSAGDVTNTPYQQIIIASGLGATAALSAIDYINRFED